MGAALDGSVNETPNLLYFSPFAFSQRLRRPSYYGSGSPGGYKGA
jgi:hypothetical protein